MSHYLVELYTPNAAWKALPVEQRQQFLGHIGSAMGGLSSLGVEVLALAEAEPGIDQGSEHRFLGIWRFPDPQVRDALRWSQVIDAMLQQWGGTAQVRVGSHGWPSFGNDRVRAELAAQRDMYRFVHDRSLQAANGGATIQELPDALNAAPGLAIDPSVRGYYGTINHDAKAVYQRYFGWWDGVPAHFNPLPPVEAAQRYVALAGGSAAMLAAAMSPVASSAPCPSFARAMCC